MPISEVVFKRAALERQHRLRAQDELQHLRQQLHENQLRQELRQTRLDTMQSLRVAIEPYKKKLVTWLEPYLSLRYKQGKALE